MTGLLRGVVVAVLVGGATVVLSSCSSDPGPMVTLTSSPTATAVATTLSPSAAPSVPSEEELLTQIPENARREDFMSASNFAKFFVREYQRMFAEHDSALFAYLSADTCKFCASSLLSFAQDEAAGSTVTGGEITTTESLATGGLQSDGTWLVQFPMFVAEARYFNEDASLRTTVAATDYNVGVLLERQAGRWIVMGLNLEVAN